jgi:hypothetical protein
MLPVAASAAPSSLAMPSQKSSMTWASRCRASASSLPIAPARAGPARSADTRRTRPLRSQPMISRRKRNQLLRIWQMSHAQKSLVHLRNRRRQHQLIVPLQEKSGEVTARRSAEPGRSRLQGIIHQQDIFGGVHLGAFGVQFNSLQNSAVLQTPSVARSSTFFVRQCLTLYHFR